MNDKNEIEVCEWISAILNIKFGTESLHDLLKDGTILCNLINTITGQPSKFPRISKSNFVQMENILFFIESAKNLNVPDSENFQTIDLFEGQNMKQVIHCLYSLSRNLNKGGRTDLPVIGPKLIDHIKFDFNEDQLQEAKRTISLQYGFSRDMNKEPKKSVN